jgi:hypothetical protein
MARAIKTAISAVGDEVFCDTPDTVPVHDGEIDSRNEGLPPHAEVVRQGYTSYIRDLPVLAVIMFPAIIDTGFNRTLEIDERHLKSVLKSVPIPVMEAYTIDSNGYRRGHFKLNMNI